ncbi:hypothetical protein SDC9_45687 [bioreactor metagenome]|uniref:SsuA/THI5-like domain-containing protein n=1 Tax=bioreactor metagenome TaxID=1076179 RepID=A0A644W6T1_9ZZZZ
MSTVNLKRYLALLLVFAMILGLSACSLFAASSPSQSPAAASPSASASPSADNRTAVNLTLLKGPTGVGAAKMLSDNDAGLTANNYKVTVSSDNSEVAARLTSGQTDIAALATNVAANLFNKSGGDIKLLALNTLGVLYILERGGTKVNSMTDLKGKTLYATGQGANPEFVLNFLLEQNGLVPGTDVKIVWKTSDEVSALMLTGDAEYCMLPVPAVTALELKTAGSDAASKIVPVLNLTEEWDNTADSSSLIMGCVVVRSKFAEENPQAVSDFLTEYAASIQYVKDNPEDAAVLVARYGITPSEAIAKAAIPDCNLICVSGKDMRDAIQGYYEVLFSVDPASIGGSIPDDSFYFFVQK